MARIFASGKLISSKLKGCISTAGHIGFDDLRRSVDLHVPKTNRRNMNFGFSGLNDRFSEGYRSVCSNQPAAKDSAMVSWSWSRKP
jgi:hypothetical protein